MSNDYPPKPEEKEGFTLRLFSTGKGCLKGYHTYEWKYLPEHICDANRENRSIIKKKDMWIIEAADAQEEVDGVIYCPFCGKNLDHLLSCMACKERDRCGHLKVLKPILDTFASYLGNTIDAEANILRVIATNCKCYRLRHSDKGSTNEETNRPTS